jgi:hypothetical protein
MRNRTTALLALTLGVLTVGASPNVFAQNNDGGNNNGGQNDGGRRGRFDPAQMRQRNMERMKEMMGATDEEFQALQPGLEKVMTLSRDARTGGGGWGGGPGGGRRGGGGDDAAQSPVGKASQELRTALENKSATPQELTQKMTAYREARQKARADLAKAQQELKELLTQRQEAALVMAGMIE